MSKSWFEKMDMGCICATCGFTAGRHQGGNALCPIGDSYQIGYRTTIFTVGPKRPTAEEMYESLRNSDAS